MAHSRYRKPLPRKNSPRNSLCCKYSPWKPCDSGTASLYHTFCDDEKRNCFIRSYTSFLHRDFLLHQLCHPLLYLVKKCLIQLLFSFHGKVKTASYRIMKHHFIYFFLCLQDRKLPLKAPDMQFAYRFYFQCCLLW